MIELIVLGGIAGFSYICHACITTPRGEPSQSDDGLKISLRYTKPPKNLEVSKLTNEELITWHAISSEENGRPTGYDWTTVLWNTGAELEKRLNKELPHE